MAAMIKNPRQYFRIPRQLKVIVLAYPHKDRNYLQQPFKRRPESKAAFSGTELPLYTKGRNIEKEIEISKKILAKYAKQRKRKISGF